MKSKNVLALIWIAAAMLTSIVRAGYPELPVDLGEAAHFTILAGSAITSSGGDIYGDAGVSPAAGSTIGLDPAQMKEGIIYATVAGGPAGSVVDPVMLAAAQGNLTTAFGDAAGRTVPDVTYVAPGELGGLTLAPGLYKFTSTAQLTSGDLTLAGGASDVWIFQIATALTVGTYRQVILSGGARAQNVFWQVGSSAELNTYCDFKGTIMADQHIVLGVGSRLEGRALARIAHVVFDGESARLANVTLTIVSDHGVGTPPTGTYVNVYGNLLTNSITPVETMGGTQYVNVGWAMTGNDPSAGLTNAMSMTHTNDAVLTWLWTTNYLLNASAGPGGIVTGDTNGFYAAGSNVTVTAVPTLGSSFLGWTGNLSGSASNVTQNMTMDQARTVVAHFTLGASNVVLQIVSAHGTGTPATGIYINVIGSLLTNSITPVETMGGTQYVNVGWAMTGNDPSAGLTNGMSMTQTNNAVLTWLWTTNYLLNASAGPGGAVTGDTNGFFAAGTHVVVTAVPGFGYTFDGWEVNGVDFGAGLELPVVIDEAKYVTAVFSPAFVDVSSDVAWNVTWLFDPRLGCFFGTLTITNTSQKILLAPIWFEVQATDWHWLRWPTGVVTNDTVVYDYLDISTAVTNQLSDGALDPGESVTVTDIELMGRREPTHTLVVAVWADPPGTLSMSVDTDGDGMADVDEYIAGTSATVPDSFFQIRMAPDNRSVQWDSRPNRLYTIFMSTNLIQGFTAVPNTIEGTGALTTYSAPPQAAGESPRSAVFYKVGVQIK